MAVQGELVNNWDNYSRNHWAGEGANIDIHIESYQAVIDGEFKYQSLFQANNFAHRIKLKDTNTYRWDRHGAAQAFGRSPGEQLTEQRFVNEKVTSVIERALYVRHVFDEQDDWTSPDLTKYVGEAQGLALAREYDRAGMTKLIHATEWKAPKALKDAGSFEDGFNQTLTGFSAAKDAKDEQADMILEAHQDLMVLLQRRDQSADIGSYVTLIAPEWFNILMHHDKLIDIRYSDGNGNFAKRRIAELNGRPIMETPVIDFQTVGANNPYGAEFTRTAAQAKTGLILFNPKHTLLELVAHDVSTRTFNYEKDMARFLDTRQMSKFEIRRGDTAYGLRAD